MHRELRQLNAPPSKPNDIPNLTPIPPKTLAVWSKQQLTFLSALHSTNFVRHCAKLTQMDIQQAQESLESTVSSSSASPTLMHDQDSLFFTHPPYLGGIAVIIEKAPPPEEVTLQSLVTEIESALGSTTTTSAEKLDSLPTFEFRGFLPSSFSLYHFALGEWASRLHSIALTDPES